MLCFEFYFVWWIIVVVGVLLGIGVVIVIEFVGCGFLVVLGVCCMDKLVELVDKICVDGGEVVVFFFDVIDFELVKLFVV